MSSSTVSSSLASERQHKTWTRDEYFVSTDPSLVDPEILNTWFASPDMHWTKSLPDAAVHCLLQTSQCFGLYHRHQRSPQEGSTTTSTTTDFIGFARLVTDFVTFAYLTDVYVLPERRAGGLGAWLVGCIREYVDEMPHLRNTVLFTSDWARSVPFYQKVLGTEIYKGGSEEQGVAILIRKGKGNAYYKPEEEETV